MYKSLQQGWITLADLCQKYNKDIGNMNRELKKLKDEYKEQVGRTWVVNEIEFLKIINIEKESTEMDKLQYQINDLAEGISNFLKLEQAQSQLLRINKMQKGEDIMKAFFELAVLSNTQMPLALSQALSNSEGFAKQLLTAEVWNRIYRKNKQA